MVNQSEIVYHIANETAKIVTNEAAKLVTPLSKFIHDHAFILILGALVLIVLFYLVLKILKNFILNSIVGLILLFLIDKFVYPIGLNLTNIIIVALGGLGGLAAVLIITFLKIVFPGII